MASGCSLEHSLRLKGPGPLRRMGMKTSSIIVGPVGSVHGRPFGAADDGRKDRIPKFGAQ